MKRLFLLLLSFYQKCISPLFPSCCRFYPTCSAYMREAVGRFGLLRGGYLGLLRFLRCNPFCRGGMDPVPERFSLLPPKRGR